MKHGPAIFAVIVTAPILLAIAAVNGVRHLLRIERDERQSGYEW